MNEAPQAGDVYLDEKETLLFYSIVNEVYKGGGACLEIDLIKEEYSFVAFKKAVFVEPKEGYSWESHQYLGKRICKAPRQKLL
jgi:hypothetical protein